MKNTKKLIIALVLVVLIISIICFYKINSRQISNKKEGVLVVATTSSQVVVGTGKIEYMTVSTANKKYSYPVITDYPNKVSMDKVNKTISDYFNGLGCDRSIVHMFGEEFSWNSKATVNHAQNNIFGVNDTGDYFCGGSYPGYYSKTSNFDMNTGEKVPFEKLFKDFIRDREKIINTIYGDLITKTNLYLSKNPGNYSTCESVGTYETLSYADYDYRVSTSTHSIYVTAGLPHVIQACEEEIEVPVQKLLPFADSSSILNRI